ncbi:AraC family transcriptional regulator [Chitinophaga sp. 22321]|uniref:Helix-turn-helix domain-containing protein n=1 Tax=Chitinophaga hostae TaxID=2831022 RepID=A0ABS5J0H4_9BACT|nr:AraC family transcriptional regulator [Chitinophaga hostae]MBS0028732.1 helix-turn-helix domain-containing protein [Chitinophaga hostae]
MKSAYQQLHLSANNSFVAREYCQPQFTAPFHFHHAYEIILIVKSYGKIYGGNKVMNFREGDIYLFGPGFGHCFYNDKSFIDTGEMAQAIVVQFTEDFMGKDFFDKPELRKVKKLLLQALAGIKFLTPTAMMQELFFQLREKKQMHGFIHLMQLLEQLSAQRKDRLLLLNDTPGKIYYHQSDASKIELVFKYVIENFKTAVNSKSAAALVFLNEAAFCRYFKRRTRKTFSQFVNEVRITHATKLLLEKEYSISEICYACGYSNVSYFNRQFKLLQGKTPKEFRNLQQRYPSQW